MSEEEIKQEGIPEGADTVYEPIVRTTECDHEYLPGTKAEDGLIVVVCDKCWHGCAYDPDTMELVGGKLIPKRIIE